MCKVGSVDFCHPLPNRPAAGNGERHQDLGRSGREMDRRSAARQGRATSAFDCTASFCGIRLCRFRRHGVQNCWVAAVASYASTHITLGKSVIEGSTWGFLAVGRRDTPQTAHSFAQEIFGSKAASYRQSSQSCDIRNDWDCPASVYADIPWGISHHHFWSPLNGALFRSRDILGNVKFANNYVYDAYNGIRATISASCRKNSECRDRTNLGFEITGNVFKNIRDNPIEPEGHAAFWIIKQNSFINVHAAVPRTGSPVMTCWSSATFLRRSASRARVAATKDGQAVASSGETRRRQVEHSRCRGR